MQPPTSSLGGLLPAPQQCGGLLMPGRGVLGDIHDGWRSTETGAHCPRPARSQQRSTWPLVIQSGEHGEGLEPSRASSGSSGMTLGGQLSSVSPSVNRCIPHGTFQFYFSSSFGVGNSGLSWVDPPWSWGNKCIWGWGCAEERPRVRRKPGPHFCLDPPQEGDLCF